MTNKSGSLENEILEFHDFPGFKWPRTLFEISKSISRQANSHVISLTEKIAGLYDGLYLTDYIWWSLL